MIRRLFFVTAVACLSLAATSTQRLALLGQKSIRYKIHAPMNSPFEMQDYVRFLRQKGFDIAGLSFKNQEIEVITDEKGLELLKQRQISGVIYDQHNKITDAGAPSFDARYYSPQKVEDHLKALQAKYPTLTRMEQIGTSLEGRAIWALLISSTPNKGDAGLTDKPSIIFDGMHHARELMSTEVVMDVAETLLASSDTPSDLSVFLAKWNVWVVPMLNVDGNNIVWTQDNWWRKNARNANGQTFGVDINRNYPYKWAACNGSSEDTSDDTYHGAQPNSEPETMALMSLGAEVQPTASLSYHSYGELVLYPYGCDGEVTGENDLLGKVAKEMAALLPSDSNDGSNYTPGPPWQILYAVDGDSMSYMFSEFGATAYTFEVNQDFQPSYDLRQPTIEKHRKAWGHFLQRMDGNLLSLKVVDGSGKPAQATINISTIAHEKGEKPFRTNGGGNFFKFLDPGSYRLDVTLANGKTTSLNVVMNGSQSQTVTIQ